MKNLIFEFLIRNKEVQVSAEKKRLKNYKKLIFVELF